MSMLQYQNLAAPPDVPTEMRWWQPASEPVRKVPPKRPELFTHPDIDAAVSSGISWYYAEIQKRPVIRPIGWYRQHQTWSTPLPWLHEPPVQAKFPLLIPVDPESPKRPRSHQQMVAALLNSLLRQGILTQIDQSEWDITIATAPVSSGATGKPGQMAFDGSYFYICTATNTWRRIALSSF